MKRKTKGEIQMKLKELQANQAETMSLLLTAIEERTGKNNNKYLTLTLSDGEDTITGNLWQTAKENFIAKIGDVLSIRLEARLYNEKLSYVINGYSVTNEDPSDYIVKAPIPSEQMYEVILRCAHNLGIYAAVVECILEDNKEKLLTWGAGKKIHHNIRGGLLYHIYRMLQASGSISKIYGESVDKNLLFAGIILHDIGKVKELETNFLGATDYTTDGVLFGHLFLGAEMIGQYAKDLLPEKETNLLKHMVVSHHGQLDMGAITTPAIPEAMILNCLDNLDARMYQFEETRKGMSPDTVSERIFGLDSRVYKP